MSWTHSLNSLAIWNKSKLKENISNYHWLLIQFSFTYVKFGFLKKIERFNLIIEKKFCRFSRNDTFSHVVEQLEAVRRRGFLQHCPKGNDIYNISTSSMNLFFYLFFILNILYWIVMLRMTRGHFVEWSLPLWYWNFLLSPVSKFAYWADSAFLKISF